MKTKLLSLFAIATLLLTAACKNEEPITEEEAAASGFIIDSKYLNYTIDNKSKNIEIQVQTSLPMSQWYLDVTDSWIFAQKKSLNNGIGTISITVDPNNTGETRTGVVKISTVSTEYKVTIKQYATSDLVIEGDFRVTPLSAKATNAQAGSEIKLSYDDNENTMFHSSWNAANTFPFEMTYNFQGNEEINYVEYVPRSDGGNGAFQEFNLYYSTAGSRDNFVKVGDTYNFNGAATPNRVMLPSGVKPTAVKFEVLSGNGGFVSCAEMKFFRRNTDTTLNRELLEVFTDLTCSELKPGVTTDDIAKLDVAFQQVAEALLNGTYDTLEKSFRIHEYQAYSNPTEWSSILMTKKYSTWDNPMGIAVKKGEKVMILVGDTHGNNLSVQILGENRATNTKGASYLTVQRQGHFVSLNEGVNLIEPDQDGQLFLMYTAVPSAATSKPIKVHIPLGYGEFCGYFDLEEHKTNDKFREIIARSSNKYFCVKGKRMVLYFRKSVLPNEIIDPINQWDNIITWQQNFMGVDDVRPGLWNNHIAGITLSEDEGGYMWASDWTMGFAESAVSKIMGLKNFNAAADNAWGPAHEMGHVNQTAINWASTTESSNNLFSNYVLYRFGRYASRGKGLYYRFGAVYEKDHSWASMNYNGDHTGPNIPFNAAENTYMGEETEIHMRLNWQLWNYYHRVKGDEEFFARVFKKMRQIGLNETEDPGRKQLEYAMACSEAAGEDLTDFFEAWGFFKPLNGTIAQYGEYRYTVTETMIANAKAKMQQYPKAGAVEYIEDRDSKAGPVSGDFAYDKVGDLGYYTTYQNKLKVSSSASATVSSRKVTTKDCGNAVGIEIREKKVNGTMGEIRFASNYISFEIPSSIDTSDCAVYAVQYDGTRIHLADIR